MSILSQQLLKEYSRQTAPKIGSLFNTTLAYSTSSTENIQYQSKYADKLMMKAKEQGCTVDALLLKQSLVQTSQDQILTPSKQIVESLSTPIPAVSRKSQTALHPPLDSLINVENFKSESVMNIEKLWTLFNSTKSCILCGSLTLDFHSILFQRAKKNPMFVLPLTVSKTTLEFYLLQFTDTQIYFTHLDAYKLNPDQAVPVLVLTHYSDLEKIVLMRGEVQGVSMDDARRLVYLVQLFYGQAKKFEIVERFSRGGVEFDYNDIIRAVNEL